MIRDKVEKNISVRLLKEDYDTVVQEASEQGMKPGTYLRHLIHLYYKRPLIDAAVNFKKLSKEEKALFGFDEDGNLLY